MLSWRVGAGAEGDVLRSPHRVLDKELSRFHAAIRKGRTLLEDAVRARLTAQGEIAELTAELRRLEAERGLLGDAVPARLPATAMRKRLAGLEKFVARSRERESLLAPTLADAESKAHSLRVEAGEIMAVWSQARRLTAVRLTAEGIAGHDTEEPWRGVPKQLLLRMGEGEVALYAAANGRLREWRRRVRMETAALAKLLRRRH